MNPSSTIKIESLEIGKSNFVYFIADIAANHDGDLNRAKDLIYLAKESGAHAAKFQHFLAKDIVSDRGFQDLGKQQSHQSSWKKSVFDTYKTYETNRSWTLELVETCQKAGIHFMTTPYDFEATETLKAYVPAFKIGSGDITWIDSIEHVASTKKPILIATGASSFEDVERAVESILKINSDIVLMQCNTNYVVDRNNFKYINLNVLKNYQLKWPGIITGLSDHTPGHSTVLGAVTLGARVVEKHFTDDNSREGPDHAFSMTPQTWKDMVGATEELLLALGDGIKQVEENELETSVLQRRCIRILKDKNPGEILQADDLKMLRPAPVGSLPPYQKDLVIGKPLLKKLSAGDCITLECVK